jgi:segregation and condensation protein A
MTDYRVRTDIYNGPMDLLLYLIRRDEVDIYDIPVARITEQYCRYVETLQIIDPNVAGDFLVLAATLMEIKSRMLLPRVEAEEGGADDLGDPRLELVRQLLEYKKFKDASFELHDAAQRQAMRWPRVPAAVSRREAADVDLEDVQIWDLVAAFNKLMSSIGAGAATHDVVFDDTPVALHAMDVVDRLQSEGGEIDFERVFIGRSKVEMIGLFLALLELIRQQRVRVTQAGMFGPIRIVLLSAEPIEIGEEWGALAQEAALKTAGAEAEGEPLNVAQPPSAVFPATGKMPAPHREANAGGDADADADDEPDEDDLEDWEGFEELSRIKTDVNIDDFPGENPAADDKPDKEHEQP